MKSPARKLRQTQDCTPKHERWEKGVRSVRRDAGRAAARNAFKLHKIASANQDQSTRWRRAASHLNPATVSVDGGISRRDFEDVESSEARTRPKTLRPP
jgi:hypothetical protein